MIELPYPPTVNSIYGSRHFRGRTIVYLTDEAREYREDVAVALGEQQPGYWLGPIAVFIVVHPPDQKKRDLDNILKAVLDSLESNGVIEDDALIEDLRIVRAEAIPGGAVSVTIHPGGSANGVLSRED